MNILARLLNRRPVRNQMEIRFHTETNHFGEHGLINVSHRKKGLAGADVRFVFVGAVEPPKLDLATLQYIWDAAEYQGYLPHHITSYGQHNDLIAQLPSLVHEDDPVPANSDLNAIAPLTYALGNDYALYPQYYVDVTPVEYKIVFERRMREIAFGWNVRPHEVDAAMVESFELRRARPAAETPATV